MKHTCIYSKSLVRMLLLFATASLCAWPSFAQQDLQVMVSGPWSYVTDTNYPGRLFLVAPGKSNHHKVYLLPGTDPTAFKSGTPSPTGTYTLDYTATKGHATKYSNPPVLSGISIGSPATKVVSILVNKNNKNYIISLPMPDGYSTYSGSMGTSESEVSNKHIPNASVGAPKQYTTWMVLHYNVVQIPDSFHLLDGTKIPTTGSSAGTFGGVSIVLGDPNDKDDDKICDHISLESVKERNQLWHVKQHARFPQVDDQGHQDHGNYDYSRCSDSNPKKYPKMTSRVEQKSCIDHVRDKDRCLAAAGSADCHASQVSVNSAIPGAAVPTTVP
jgi:hypothetical protein